MIKGVSSLESLPEQGVHVDCVARSEIMPKLTLTLTLTL